MSEVIDESILNTEASDDPTPPLNDDQIAELLGEDGEIMEITEQKDESDDVVMLDDDDDDTPEPILVIDMDEDEDVTTDGPESQEELAADAPAPGAPEASAPAQEASEASAPDQEAPEVQDVPDSSGAPDASAQASEASDASAPEVPGSTEAQDAQDVPDSLGASDASAQEIPEAPEAPEAPEIAAEIDEEVLLAEQNGVLDEGFDETDDIIIEEEAVEEAEAVEPPINTENQENALEMLEERLKKNEEKEIVEKSDVKPEDEDIIHMETDSVETSSRKRTGGATSPRSPAQKRPKRRVQTLLKMRQNAIELLTRLYGSWDAQLSLSNLETIRLLGVNNNRKLIEIFEENEQVLKQKVSALTEELKKEKLAHAGTRSALKELTNEITGMRVQMNKLRSMVTQPTTSKIIDSFVQRHQAFEQQQQFQHQHHQHRPIMLAPRHHPPPPPHFTPNQRAAAPYHPNMVQPNRLAAMPHRRPIIGMQQQNSAPPQFNGHQALVPSPQSSSAFSRPPPTQLATQRRAPPLASTGLPATVRWEAIPPPKNPNVGHNEPPLNNGGRAQPLIDNTRVHDNTIMLCVPLVSTANTISSGDSTRLPKVPRIYENLTANPDLSVTIHSSAQDFRENYQIGGKINYEYLGGFDQYNIQVFVQVSSLKFTGMNGYPDPEDRISIDWGCSKLWPCKPKSHHKFRVRFHQAQLLPKNDRITIVAVAKDKTSGIIHISQPTFITLE